MSLTDNMNDQQHIALNSIKTQNTGGTAQGWTLSEFGHRMRGDEAIVVCVRVNAKEKLRKRVEYSVDPKGRATVLSDNTVPYA